MILRGFSRAFRLELRSMWERKLNLLFFLLVPAIIIWIYHTSATMAITWGNYASLNLKMYDLMASSVFPIILLFVTIQLAVLRIVGERAPYGTLDRELIAISRSGMYFGKLFANLLFILLQVIIVYLTGFIMFPARNYGSLIPILLFLVLISTFGLVFGIGISIFSKTKEGAVQLVPFFILIFMILSGVVVSLNQMPERMQIIAKNSPLTISIQSLNMLTLDGVGFEDVKMNAIKLICWIGVLIVFSLTKFKYERKR